MKRFMSDKGSVVSGLLWTVALILICAAVFTAVVLPGVNSHFKGKSSSDFGMAQGESKHGADLDKYHLPDAAEIEPVQGVDKPGLDLQAAIAGSPELMARGKELFATQCVACHGATGKGDAPAGVALGARNFTQPEGWKNGNLFTDIVTTLSAGLPPKMPTFEHLPAEDRFALAHHVIELSGFARPRPSAAQVATLDERFGFSKGQSEPNKVPISLAMRRIDEENSDTPRLALERITSPEGMKLAVRVIEDVARVRQTLNGVRGLNADPGTVTRILVAGVPGNGFNANLLTLSANQWAVLQRALGEIGL
jgi:mono/diheme cytochrome c family protein